MVDAFLAFWFRFIYRHRSAIEIGNMGFEYWILRANLSHNLSNQLLIRRNGLAFCFFGSAFSRFILEDPLGDLSGSEGLIRSVPQELRYGFG